MKPPRVYLVTEEGLAADLAAAVRAALAGLPPWSVAVQLREKGMPARQLLQLARALQSACGAAAQPLLVNDRLDVALAAGAAGVHLPSAGIPTQEARRLLRPGALVGVSCHSVEDVVRAAAGGADFATFGPVFDTPSKRRYGAPVGLGRLAEAARVGLPLLGLGGVDLASAGRVMAAGAHGVAAIRAWLSAPDPAAAVRALLAACA
ncbi:MAG TPA: thiamine phosphate synthase [Anaeromyxobacteraceae bacterium]|nr:thiamine phosphate synthase [Anaeromyxobacteraceae bacterium]